MVRIHPRQLRKGTRHLIIALAALNNRFPLLTNSIGSQMPIYKQTQTTKRSDPESQAEEQTAKQESTLNDDIEEILGDIDEVLETNAEEFVRAYVQKGGQ